MAGENDKKKCMYFLSSFWRSCFLPFFVCSSVLDIAWASECKSTSHSTFAVHHGGSIIKTSVHTRRNFEKSERMPCMDTWQLAQA